MTNIDAYTVLLNNMTPWELLRLEADTPKEAALLTALAEVLEYTVEPVPTTAPIRVRCAVPLHRFKHDRN